MRKIYIIVFIAIIILAGVFLISSQEERITNYPTKEGSIVALGDSLVVGIGATEDQDFPAVLGRMINEPIINLGVAGETTADGLKRIDEVLAENPRIVLVLLGGNDYLKKIDTEETFRNLENIINVVQKDGAVVVLLGVQGGLLRDQYEKHFEDLAKRKGALYVPNVLDGLIGRPSLMSDAIHPNNTGYQKIAEKIYPVIQKVLQ